MEKFEKMINVMYLTWGETPRSFGVFGSQVVSQLCATLEASSDVSIKLVAGLPVLHSGLVREGLSYKNELIKVRKKLGVINFSTIPIFAPQTFVNSTKAEFPFFHGFAYQRLNQEIRRFNPQILHCRSYHATYAALKIREKYGYRYKVIFDARGLFPEECVQKRNFPVGGSDFAFLKTIEIFLLENSDVTIAVSDTMHSHYSRIGVAHAKTVYLSAPVDKLLTANKKSGSKSKVLCYVGALSEDSWHKPKDLFELYRKYRICVQNPKLLIVTLSNRSEIMMHSQGIPESEIEIVSSRSDVELVKFLADADFGALPFHTPKSDIDHAIASTMIGSKTAEYLGAGLPVLVNRFCMGAASIVELNQLGICYDPETFNQININSLKNFENVDFRIKTKELAKRLFDYRENGSRYFLIYKALA